MKLLIILLSTLFVVACDVGVGNSADENTEDNDVDIDNSINGSDEKPKDCPKDLLWKPKSESDGKLVILFDAEFEEKFDSVAVTDLEGNLEQGTFSDFTNGDRQTWRFKKTGEEYTGVVDVQTEDETCTIVVSEPGERGE